MNVDDPRGIQFDELMRQNLHVASQHHQVDAAGRQQTELRLLGRAPLFRVDGDMVEFDPVEARQRLAFRVIANDQRNRAMQLSGLMAVEQIRQAV